MERIVTCIENNPVKAGLVAERLERRSRPGLRAEARSGTLKRAPQYRLLPAAPRLPLQFRGSVADSCRRATRANAAARGAR